ncbi:hypothetical protein HYH02_001519 [Chlamydomonas schloesseri]|uniref:Uncharacterized protein n=1 Tax=Chlamydomonas schloesseri TaxID=2026947 RepID=A0A836BB66_9CHLO|nr:hypothetical protein HYH02_001519 [Chlamydomonas schloesseri]|eukprot:KAG2453292.1 hypothetical protein HYH02_001519 [Chlamydomonas schloesseri]
MSLGEAFRTAVYKEPVMVWSLMIYGVGISYAAFVKPSMIESHSKDLPSAPPSLKEVMAGIQAKLNNK